MDIALCSAAPALGPSTLVVIVALVVTVLASAGLTIGRRRQERREAGRHAVMRLNLYRVPLLPEELARFSDRTRSAEDFAADVRAFARRPREAAVEAVSAVA